MTNPVVISPFTGFSVDPNTEAVLLEGLSFGLRRAASLGESFNRANAAVAAVSLTSGQTSYTSVLLARGTLVSNITVFVNGAAVTPTHGVVGLYNSALAQVATSADTATAAWAATAELAFAMSSAYKVPADGLYYVGVSTTAATPATLAGRTGIPTLNLLAPAVAFQDTTAVTTALPATATQSAGGSVFWAYVS